MADKEITVYADPQVLADIYFENDVRPLLVSAFRKISLYYCVSTSDFYDTVHEMEFAEDEIFAESEKRIDYLPEDMAIYSRNEESRKSNYRLNTLIARLLKDPENESDIGAEEKKIFRPKVFDSKMDEVNKTLYKSVAKLLKDEEFLNSVPNAYLRAFAPGERKKFMFSEYAALCCLYKAVRKSSIKTLNRPISTRNETISARRKFKKITEVLFSESYYDALVREVFWLLAGEYDKEYRELVNDHCREFWIPAEKCTNKHLDEAIQKFQLSTPRSNRVDCDINEYYAQNGIVKITLNNEKAENISIDLNSSKKAETERDYAYLRYLDQISRMDLLQTVFWEACPVAELMLTKNVVPNLEDNGVADFREALLASCKVGEIAKKHITDSNDKQGVYVVTGLVACKIAAIVDVYVRATRVSVIKLLECLPEASVTGERNMWEYLSSLR